MKRLLFVPSLVVLALVALLAAVPAGAAEITTGHSGWFWGNPQPQGNALRVIGFAGARGFAAGDFGTLLRTEDRGRSWTGVPLGPPATLGHLSIPDQDHVVVGGGCDIYRSSDGGVTFTLLHPRLQCAHPAESFSWPSANVGYELDEDGAISRTTDGLTFAHRGDLPKTEAAGVVTDRDVPQDVFFTDDNTGFAIAGGPTSSTVYRTTDGGATWFARTSVPQTLTSVYFADASTGYAIGSENTVLKTTDGGETWGPKPVPDSVPSSLLEAIRCGTPSNCMITTEHGDFVLRTANGGNSFTSISPAPDKTFAVGFSSPSRAVAVGDHGTMVLSTNADAATPSFVPVADQPLPAPLTRLRSGIGSLVLATGAGGKLARSTDGGHHWDTVQVPTSEDLRDVWFVDQNTGFVLDAAGKVQRTTDGGAGWTDLPTGTDARPNAIYAPDANTVLLFGPMGVRRSTNGAEPSFDPVASKAARGAALTSYDRTAGLALFAYGPTQLIVSYDKGASWRAVRGPVKNPHYRSVDFLTGKLGYVLLRSGRLFWTRSGGKRWSEMLGIGTAQGTQLSFGDARNGYLAIDRFGGTVGQEGWALRTSDGGSTWRPQLIGPDPLAGIVAPDASTAFALGDSRQLFYTSVGGDASVQSKLTLAPARRTIRHNRTVRISGKLTPAFPEAVVTVSAHNPATGRWTVIGRPVVAPDGTFSLSHKVRHTTQYVAQWPGSAVISGDGSPMVSVVKRKR